MASIGAGEGRSVPPELIAAAVAPGRGPVELTGYGAAETAAAVIDTRLDLTLVLARLGAEPFTAVERNVLHGIGRVLGLTLRLHRGLREERRQAAENARLLTSLTDRERTLEELAKIQRAISARSRLDEVLDQVVRSVATVLRSEVAGLRLVDEYDPSYVVLAASTGLDEAAERALRRAPIGESVGGEAIEHGRVAVTNDYPASPGPLGALGLRAALAAPVHEHGSVIGSLVVATATDRRYDAQDAETLTHFAEHAGVAIATARAADAVRQALNDPLTGLPNRALFLDRLEHALARADRAGSEVSVLFLDVDGFKLVNDSLGHLAGDRLLVEVARRLQACLRRSDTAARLGGDEFAVLLTPETGQLEPSEVARRIGQALQPPFLLADRELRVTASIGIASGRGEPENLLRDADVAMYRAKRRARGSFALFEPGMHAAILEELELQNDLHAAVARGEIAVHYQPIVRLADGGIPAVEALARWEHPTRGAVPPDVFIPLAEASGIIDEIGSLVLAQASAQLAAWRRAQVGSPRLQLTLNVSPAQDRDRLAAEIGEQLGRHGLAPSSLVLEITESGLVHDSEETLARLAAARRQGLQVAIDDFGTGYSSLRYLRRLPVDILKIAKPFVDGIADERGEEWALARMIIDLAHALGLETVAEGVETPAQRQRLLELGCDYAQGYHFAPPIPAGELEPLLRRDARRADAHAPAAPAASAVAAVETRA